MIPAEGGSPELIYRSATNSADPNWSPDGKSLVFGENSLNNQGSAIYVLDLKTRKASKLPESDGLYSPRWSPDGRYIVAITLDSLKLMLFDFTTQKWSELAEIFVAYPTWSRDGRYVYFDGILDNQESYFRVQIGDSKLERIFSLKGFSGGRRSLRKLERPRPGRNSAARPRRQHPGNLRSRCGDALISLVRY